MSEVSAVNTPVPTQIRCRRCGDRGCWHCAPGSLPPCAHCGQLIPAKRFAASRGGAKYCSNRCSREHYKQQYAIHNKRAYADIATGTVGAINELRVSVDLLAKGNAVFRALSPSCPCDLVLLIGNQVFRVEVTTGHYDRGGVLRYPTKDGARFDVLAVVVQDTIVYFTEIQELQLLVCKPINSAPRVIRAGQ
jgi:hypothetical protein